MLDGQGRTINYLRISVTDRCNLRCIYCMPKEGVRAMEHRDILSFEEIYRLVGIMTGLGITHLRLTGGEPMARKGCLKLAAGLNDIPGVESISMTSNGLLLKDRIREVKEAGISSLNLSIDSTDPEVYALLTRGGDVRDALTTLRQALDEGMNVKVNAVPIRGYNEGDLVSLAGLAKKDPLCVRFIELMPIGCGSEAEGIPMSEVEETLEHAFGKPVPDTEIHGYGPAKYVKYSGFKGSVGFIGAVSHEFCDQCNRVRLTADGQLKLCLNHTKGIDLRGMLRGGMGDEAIRDAIAGAISEKPERHAFFESIGDCEKRCMNEIGG